MGGSVNFGQITGNKISSVGTTLYVMPSTSNLVAALAMAEANATAINPYYISCTTFKYQTVVPLVMPSYTTLDLNGSIIEGNDTDGFPILINSDTSGGNTDIRIINGTIDANMTGKTTYQVIETGFVLGTMGTYFNNVNGLSFENINVLDANKFALAVWNITRFKAHNIYLNTNSDGIHLTGPISQAQITGVTGHCGDDVIALTSENFDDYNIVGGGIISGVTVRDVQVSTDASVLKIAGSTGNYFENILYDGIQVQDSSPCLSIQSDSEAQANNTATEVRDVTLKNATYKDTESGIVARLTSYSGRPVTIEVLTIDGVKIRSNTAANLVSYTDGGGLGTENLSVDMIKFCNISARGITTRAIRLFQLEAGSPNNIELFNVDCKTIDKIINQKPAGIDGMNMIISNVRIDDVNQGFWISRQANLYFSNYISTNQAGVWPVVYANSATCDVDIFGEIQTTGAVLSENGGVARVNGANLRLDLTSGSPELVTTTSLVTGDIAFDKTSAVLVKWSGAAWVAA